MNKLLSYLTVAALSVTALVACSTKTNTKTLLTAPTYAKHLYTSSDSDGNITIVSGAPSNADPKLELEHAEQVTHTFSDGTSQSWTNIEGAVFAKNIDYGLNESKNIFNIIVKLEHPTTTDTIETQALTAGPCSHELAVQLFCHTLIGKQRLWPTRVIYYYIDSHFSENDKQTIINAINMWNETLSSPKIRTDLRWMPYKGSQSAMVAAYNAGEVINFVQPSSPNISCGLNSGATIGKLYGPNKIYLNMTDIKNGYCGSLTYVVLHEMGHKMGLYHEHARCDYLDAGIEFYKMKYPESTKFAEKIQGRTLTIKEFDDYTEAACDYLDDSFTPSLPENIVGPYDVNSVMHYAFNQSFSIDEAFGKIKFRFIDTTKNTEQTLLSIGSRENPSSSDAVAVSDLYRCELAVPSPVQQTGTSLLPLCKSGE